MSFPQTVAAAATVLLALSVQAAEPAKKNRSLLLSKEELRACMTTKDRLQQQRVEIDRLQNELATEKAALQKSGVELQEQLAALDRTNLEAVQKHVDMNNDREKRIDAYEAKAGQYNAKVETLKADKDVYARDCERKRFDEADEIAIKKGK